MAYAAVISLKKTIQRFVNLHILIVPIEFVYLQELEFRSFLTRKSGKEFLFEITDFAYMEVESLQRILKDINSSSSERVNSLEGQIRDAAYKFEDVLESHISNQFLLQYECFGDISSTVDLKKLKQDIDSFTETVKKVKEELINELNNPSSQEYDAVSSRIDFGGKKSKMVGLSDQLREIGNLISSWWSRRVEFVSLVGMAGIGKTTLATEIFQDSLSSGMFHPHRFHKYAFVTIGPKYQLKEIMLSILAQLNPDQTDIMPTQGDDELLAKHLYKSLFGRRYFIVLDDVWHKQVSDDLKKLLPDSYNGSRVLITTRLDEVAQGSVAVEFGVLKMPFLNKEESWCLLREKVFAEDECCPPQLEKAGKKIAENCDGLPLAIVTVAKMLSKSEKTPDYWNKVANKENSVFIDAYDQISIVIYPSYKFLPQRLKACFLYIGTFPPKYEIPHYNLISLWSAEGFLEPDRYESIEHFVEKCLKELVSRNLILVHQRSFRGRIKTCGLHSVIWHLCNKEARKNKFSHVINSYASGLTESIKSQRRLCIHNNILFGIKDLYKSMTSITNARSLLCTGPYHQYPVPICLGLKLLRVLDALKIRLYEFPVEVLKLVQLRYLALTYNGNLPSSISKLWKLQFLIVRRHMSTKFSTSFSYLPMEIWNMEELEHLQVMGGNLPDPCDDALLPNLLTLLDVSARSCTKDVLEKIPNLLKLGIQIELSPNDVDPFCCFDHIFRLRRLKSLKCVIVNPTLSSEVVLPSSPPIFPSYLVKLTLRGFGFPWEYMREIAKLRNLEVLKLQCYAFRGPKWETYDEAFLRLDVLVIEDTDLVHWTVGPGSFPNLERLIIRHCYKLQEIPLEFGKPLEKIEIVDCNPLVVSLAKQIKEDQRRNGTVIDVNVHSSCS